MDDSLSIIHYFVIPLAGVSRNDNSVAAMFMHGRAARLRTVRSTFPSRQPRIDATNDVF